MIDFQDGLIGNSAYDLVSLLQDVRTFISQKDQNILYRYYIKNSKVNEESFREAYIILGTQRLLKIVGIFCRLAKLEKKTLYLNYLPRTFKLLHSNLEKNIFSELRLWILKNDKNEKAFK